jgi:hypothetical protein
MFKYWANICAPISIREQLRSKQDDEVIVLYTAFQISPEQEKRPVEKAKRKRVSKSTSPSSDTEKKADHHKRVPATLSLS